MFVFQLDSTSGVPPYLQLVHQVRQAVMVGYLREGDRLPLIREAVEQLAINPNTVSKAYRQLEHEGLVDPRPGVGTFVARAPAVTVPPAQYAKLRRGLERWLREAEAAGLDEEAVGALLAVVRRDLAEEGVA
ncbi:GntR family transcriptional regulator [Jiangella alkaliphila]|uniref:Transcriptional regulator, GntR family n=1 Tax=Jiangella alkaliphila TaxID=419479 RepID=A0A1H2GMU6_9ACTN|nr:GntR family transcriptional regulator [Jiangella alkaliphila]SDU20865.1 transcriptional regulator, GntR family [Jiangella alkaliphila]